LGIGVKIPLSENLKLSLAYDEQAGLIDIFEAGSSISNRRTSLNVGVAFTVKKNHLKGINF
jgi:hypothetical protein